MKIDEIPSLPSSKYPERVSVALSSDSIIKLEKIRALKNKKPSILIRELVEEFLEQNKEFFEPEAS